MLKRVPPVSFVYLQVYEWYFVKKNELLLNDDHELRLILIRRALKTIHSS